MASAPQSNGHTAKPVTIVVVGAGSRGTVSLPPHLQISLRTPSPADFIRLMQVTLSKIQSSPRLSL